MSSEEDIYEVGEVLKDRKKRGQIEYLIRWKNYGVEEDSWEPASNLQNATSLLKEYINRKPAKSRPRSKSRSRSRSRTRLPKKTEKTTPEKSSRENTPIKVDDSRESTPTKKGEDLVTLPSNEEAPPTKVVQEPVTQVEGVVDNPTVKVVTELSNDGVEQTPVTAFTSTQVSTETTEVYTPVSESISTVLSRRMEMRAAAKATEMAEEEAKEAVVTSQKVMEQREEKTAESVDVVDSVTGKKVDETATIATKPLLQDLRGTPVRKWPIVVFAVSLLVIGISFLVEKYLLK